MAAHDDAVADVEAEPGALAHILSREERLDYSPLHLRRYPGPCVGDLDSDAFALAARADGRGALAAHGVDRVVDDVGPDLVELARLRADLRQGAVVITDELDTSFELVAKDHKGAFKAVVNVYLVELRPIKDHPPRIEAAFDLGVKIVAGTDAGFVPFDALIGELVGLSECGLGPADALAAATINAASVLRRDALGEIAVGRIADAPAWAKSRIRAERRSTSTLGPSPVPARDTRRRSII